MSWLNKFQQGGAAGQQIGKIMQQLTTVTQKAMQGDPEAMQQVAAFVSDQNSAQVLQIVKQQNPQLFDAMVQVADAFNQGQTEAYAKGGMLDYIHTLRCGGKTKKKEDGGQAQKKVSFKRVKKEAKGGCPCQLKKIGGRLVNVDCEGNIIK